MRRRCFEQNLYNNITSLYPNANTWVVGHSLGGSLASLLGVTFGVPVVAFEGKLSSLLFKSHRISAWMTSMNVRKIIESYEQEKSSTVH